MTGKFFDRHATLLAPSSHDWTRIRDAVREEAEAYLANWIPHSWRRGLGRTISDSNDATCFQHGEKKGEHIHQDVRRRDESTDADVKKAFDDGRQPGAGAISPRL